MAMKAIFAVLVVQLILPAAVVSQQQTEPADMQAYIAEIRQMGISEIAKSALLTIATVRNGYNKLSCQQAPDGSYSMSYTSPFCKNPNVDPEIERKEKEKRDMENAAEIVRLKPLADIDKSGFVTSVEAMRFKRLVEFGYKVAYVEEQEHNDMQAVCKAMGMSEDALRQQLTEYRALQDKVIELRLKPFPDVALK